MYLSAKNTNADWIVGDFNIIYPDGSVIEKKFFDFGELNNIGFLKYCFLNGDFYYTGRLIKKELFKIANIFVPAEITFGEDNVAVIQLGFHLKKAIKVNTVVLYYVQRISSVTNKYEKRDLIPNFSMFYVTGFIYHIYITD